MVNGDEGCVTGEAAEGFRGNAGPVVQGGGEGVVGGEGILVEVHDDLGAVATAAGADGVGVGEVALGDLHQGVRCR
jgi:hypothetical protein